MATINLRSVGKCGDCAVNTLITCPQALRVHHYITPGTVHQNIHIEYSFILKLLTGTLCGYDHRTPNFARTLSGRVKVTTITTGFYSLAGVLAIGLTLLISHFGRPLSSYLSVTIRGMDEA